MLSKFRPATITCVALLYEMMQIPTRIPSLMMETLLTQIAPNASIIAVRLRDAGFREESFLALVQFIFELLPDVAARSTGAINRVLERVLDQPQSISKILETNLGTSADGFAAAHLSARNCVALYCFCWIFYPTSSSKADYHLWHVG